MSTTFDTVFGTPASTSAAHTVGSQNYSAPMLGSAPTTQAASIDSAALQQQMLAQSNIQQQQQVGNFNAAIQSGQQYGMSPTMAAMQMGNNLANTNQSIGSQNASNLASLGYETAQTNAGYQQQANLANTGYQAQYGLANQQSQLSTNATNSQAYLGAQQINQGYYSAQSGSNSGIVGGVLGGVSKAMGSDENVKEPYVTDSGRSGLSLGAGDAEYQRQTSLDSANDTGSDSSGSLDLSNHSPDTPRSGLTLDGSDPTNKNAQTDAAEKIMKDSLNTVSESNKKMGVWKYKDDSAFSDGGKPHLGPSAQDLEKHPLTDNLVVDTPAGKALDPVAVGQYTLAGLGHQQDDMNFTKSALADLYQKMGLQLPDKLQQHVQQSSQGGQQQMQQGQQAPTSGQQAIQQQQQQLNQYGQVTNQANNAQVQNSQQAGDQLKSIMESQYNIGNKIVGAKESYGQAIERIKSNYPNMSYQSVWDNMQPTEKTVKIIGFLLGGLSQGLLHSASNPAVDAYDQSVKSMIDANKYGYERDMKAAQEQYGTTIDGLQAQYNIAKDNAGLIAQRNQVINDSWQHVISNAGSAYDKAAVLSQVVQTNRQLNIQQENANTEANRLGMEVYNKQMGLMMNPNYMQLDTGDGKPVSVVAKDEGSKKELAKIPEIVNTNKQIEMTMNKINAAIASARKGTLSRPELDNLAQDQLIVNKALGIEGKENQPGSGSSEISPFNISVHGQTTGGDVGSDAMTRLVTTRDALSRKLAENKNMIRKTVQTNGYSGQQMAEGYAMMNRGYSLGGRNGR